MLSLVLKISEESACVVNGSEAEFISLKYRLYPDCISIEVMKSVHGDIQQCLVKTLPDDESISICLEESVYQSIEGGAEIGVPVRRHGTRCKRIDVFKNSSLIYNQNIEVSGYCELDIVINNSYSIYEMNIRHGDVINQALAVEPIDLSGGDVIMIEPDTQDVNSG